MFCERQALDEPSQARTRPPVIGQHLPPDPVQPRQFLARGDVVEPAPGDGHRFREEIVDGIGRARGGRDIERADRGRAQTTPRIGPRECGAGSPWPESVRHSGRSFTRRLGPPLFASRTGLSRAESATQSSRDCSGSPVARFAEPAAEVDVFGFHEPRCTTGGAVGGAYESPGDSVGSSMQECRCALRRWAPRCTRGHAPAVSGSRGVEYDRGPAAARGPGVAPASPVARSAGPSGLFFGGHRWGIRAPRAIIAPE